MANELVSQVMKDLARRAGVASVSSYPAKKDVQPSNLDSKEDEFLRRLAHHGRAFSLENTERSVDRRLPGGRNLNSSFEDAQKVTASSLSGKQDIIGGRDIRGSRQNSSKEKNAIDLDELAKRSEGQGHQ